MVERIIGVDLGAETVKLVVLERRGGGLAWVDRRIVEHHKGPREAAEDLLAASAASGVFTTVVAGAATGRAGRLLNLERIPVKGAAAAGIRFLYPERSPCTVVSIGSHGFYVLELLGRDHEVFRENTRCSQGTGNFLRQLVERFNLTIDEASHLCADVAKPAPLSGRCPVILKTDMTHLANKGESQARILAGLYDAVCENVQVLIRPSVSPADTLLIGGVARSSRIRTNLEAFLAARNMRLHPGNVGDDLFVEALGAAVVAAERQFAVPGFDDLLRAGEDARFESLPPLSAARARVHRMTAPPPPADPGPRQVVVGFDIGSTGSKAVALDISRQEPIWKGYLDTRGNPVGAAQELAGRFLTETGGQHTVRAVGTTGSGREIVASLMAICFGAGRVFVLNEIAAHAEGALFFDPAVDTIFEIGGQDAKYVRLDRGRICDAAMNEACSAGTGSFIAEQGQKLRQVEDVVHLGAIAVKAERGISLGQHCSVFMAEIIDEAVSSGVETPAIAAGLYDAVVQNYLNRVKGNRSVGRRVFCQGMPFSSDALAAAVARQTGSDVVVPPDPGTVGALGIALLAARELGAGQDLGAAGPLDLSVLSKATTPTKDTFICQSQKGCGGSGNRCRIDRLRVEVAGHERRFVWGGNCSLYDTSTRGRKLPDLSPDPFHERAALIAALWEPLKQRTGRPVVALSDELALKGLTPFFITFLHTLGFDLELPASATQRSLKRGIEVANVPFCAPMQIYHGVMAELAEVQPDYLLMPMLRELPRSMDEAHATTCPVVQASPDLVGPLLDRSPRTRVLAPRIDMGPGNLVSARFRESCQDLARSLGRAAGWRRAFGQAVQVQQTFERQCRDIGRRALDFACENEVLAIVVLGRTYTIYNAVLNSNVPNLLREQGTIAIPVDCYAVDERVPVFRGVYWGQSQINLRAAHQIRRQDGVYGIFCSNYSCGPDSFDLHFFQYIMRNKPYAIIETDGHSGDAGTRTRIEAFLHCVEGDRRLTAEERSTLHRTQLKAVENRNIGLLEAGQREELIEIPPLGVGSQVLAATMRASGLRAETLPLPDLETLRIGRKYTSGKECVPMIITLGSILQRLARDESGDERFAFLMPTTGGPCRLGVYNLLHKIVLEQLGHGDRVSIVAPSDTDYFAGLPRDFQVRAWMGFVAADLLLMALHDVRPVETVAGGAQAIFDRHFERLLRLLESLPGGDLVVALAEASGEAFGIRSLVRQAAREFAAIKDRSRDIPTVSLVGEIYCRLDPFANGFVQDQLESRGLRVQMAAFSEWLEYAALLRKKRIAQGRPREGDDPVVAHLTAAIQNATLDRCYGWMAAALGWPARRTTVKDALAAARPYLSDDLSGEAVLTLGGPLHEFVRGNISGVVSVGPLECMPSKIAEAQYCHVTEESGLVVLSLSLNGDPLDPETIDRFVFEVQRFHAAKNGRHKGRIRRAIRPTHPITAVAPGPGRRPDWHRWVEVLAGQATMMSLKLLRPLSAGIRRSWRVLAASLGLSGWSAMKSTGSDGDRTMGDGHKPDLPGTRAKPADLRWPVTNGTKDVPRV